MEDAETASLAMAEVLVMAERPKRRAFKEFVFFAGEERGAARVVTDARTVSMALVDVGVIDGCDN